MKLGNIFALPVESKRVVLTDSPRKNFSFSENAGSFDCMNSDELIQAAKALPPAGRYPTDTVMGAVEIMRAKGYKFRAIHKFLLEKGMNVHPDANSFTSVMSRRLKRARIKAMEAG